ncbi:MAG TPA: lysophospholipid acyltransferase family protein [Longimicrobiaceae bacterium]
MFYLRVALSLLGFVGASIYAVFIALVRRDRSRVAYDYARAMVKLMRPPLGVKVQVEGRENMTRQRPCIYIANHQSAFDVPVLAELHLPDTVVVGKKELARIPLFGWLYKVTGNVLIDRSNTTHAVGRLREAEVAIRERGVSVWIFPEGTRGRLPGQLLPFKKGAFYMAVATGAPLVPVVVGPVSEVFDLHRRIARPGTVSVRVLAPIPTEGLGDADVGELMRVARERMEKALTELSSGLAPRTVPAKGVRPELPG